MSDMGRGPGDWGAFLPGPRLMVAPTGSGVLDGLRFAVKDLIDTAGVVTGAGNPDWASSHSPAAAHAQGVSRLLAAGAAVHGKTITDELAFSLEGENAFYGTPRNPRDQQRLPGGSSSGSAVAVAAALVDFALGTDTGGSVRVPASFCGLFGFRPTHGAVPMAGVVPFAPGFDTIGWFARTGAMLQRVGGVLLDPPLARGGERPLSLQVAGDVFDAADLDVAAPLRELAYELAADFATDFSNQLADDLTQDPLDELPASVFGGDPAAWLHAYATLQGAQIRESLGGWIRSTGPRFGPNIAPRFEGLASITDAQIAQAQRWQATQRQRLLRWLGASRALLIPSAPGPALLRTADAAKRAVFYQRALAIGSIAGHAGLPQVSLPLLELDGLPIGLSIVGPPGSDAALLALASRCDARAPMHRSVG